MARGMSTVWRHILPLALIVSLILRFKMIGSLMNATVYLLFLRIPQKSG